MKRAIRNLAQLCDAALYETLSEGLPLIVENATSLDESARRLYRDGDLRASQVMRGFAEEEAAKILILLDYVRCPRKSEQKKANQVLKRFYGHVAKRVHAMACEFPMIESFEDLSEFVESECLPRYLDGPSGVDWIFPNAISENREHELYVDYVQEVTDTAGACFWISPTPPVIFLSQYQTSDCVTLAQALFEAGAFSTNGLADIADVWRVFEPTSKTGRGELRDLIGESLRRLGSHWGAVEEDKAGFIKSHWPFPLWPLTLNEPRQTDDNLERLREERRRAVQWKEETEAKRNPPPAVSRSVVEDVSDAYAAWRSDVEARAVRAGGPDDRAFRIRTAADSARDFDLPSYSHAIRKLKALSEEERAALLALGWFAHARTADWPGTYERAIELTPTYDEHYQLGYGSYWLSGLRRWESTPTSFTAGQTYALNHP